MPMCPEGTRLLVEHAQKEDAKNGVFRSMERGFVSAAYLEAKTKASDDADRTYSDHLKSCPICRRPEA